jgi:hypothetical protein
LRGKSFLSLYSNPVCQTLSKACVMSRKAAEQYLWSSRSCLIFLLTLWICRIVVGTQIDGRE